MEWALKDPACLSSDSSWTFLANKPNVGVHGISFTQRGQWIEGHHRKPLVVHVAGTVFIFVKGVEKARPVRPLFGSMLKGNLKFPFSKKNFH